MYRFLGLHSLYHVIFLDYSLLLAVALARQCKGGVGGLGWGEDWGGVRGLGWGERTGVG